MSDAEAVERMRRRLAWMRSELSQGRSPPGSMSTTDAFWRLDHMERVFGEHGEALPSGEALSELAAKARRWEAAAARRRERRLGPFEGGEA